MRRGRLANVLLIGNELVVRVVAARAAARGTYVLYRGTRTARARAAPRNPCSHYF